MFTWRFDQDGNAVAERVPTGVEEDRLSSVIGILPTENGAGILWVQGQTLRLTGLTGVGAELWTSTLATNVADASAAWNGESFGVVWRETVGSKKLAFGEVDALGALASDPAVIARDSPGSFIGPQLVWTGTVFGLLWREYLSRDFNLNHFVRLDRSGAVLGEALTWSEEQFDGRPSLAWTEGEFAILSLADRRGSETGSTASFTLRLRVVDAVGNVVGRTVVSPDFRKHSTFHLQLRPIWADGGLSFASANELENADLVFSRFECE